jgi:hypothetical protein
MLAQVSPIRRYAVRRSWREREVNTRWHGTPARLWRSRRLHRLVELAAAASAKARIQAPDVPLTPISSRAGRIKV